MIRTRARGYQGDGIRGQYLTITEHSKVGDIDKEIADCNHGNSNQQSAGEGPKGDGDIKIRKSISKTYFSTFFVSSIA